MHRDPVVSSLLKSAASNKDHWCVVRWDPAQICIGKPSRWERWGGWSDGGGESDIFWVVRLRVREVRDNGYWWKSLVILYQKFPEIWKRWLTQSLDCVSERFANVWLDDELDYHAGLWSYATGPQPVEHQNQYEMYLKEELFEVLFGKLATMCTPITCYDLRNCYQMVVGNHFNTNRNRWNDFRITYYLKANSTHSQNLSLMSVSPPPKKKNNFVSTNSAPHGSSCYPESSILNPNPCIVRASFGHSIAPESPPKRAAPKTKREDIILLLNKVLGDEARWDEGIKQLHWLDVESVLLFCGVPPEYIKHPFEGAMVNGWMFPVKRHPKQI